MPDGVNMQYIDLSGKVALVKDAQHEKTVIVVDAVEYTLPYMSQSPFVSNILVTSAEFPDVTLTGEDARTVDVIVSPTYPAEAALFVPHPTMPPVDGENTILVAELTPSVGVTRVGDVA